MRIIITESQFNKLINESLYGKVAMDTRFWEVWDDNTEKFIGLYSYGDLINYYGGPTLEYALNKIKNLGYSYQLVDDLYPLEQKSIYPEIQALKDKYLRKENDKNKQRAKTKGFKLTSIVPIGKYKGFTFKELIDKYPSYMLWAIKEKVFLLNPEIKEYMKY